MPTINNPKPQQQSVWLSRMSIRAALSDMIGGGTGSQVMQRIAAPTVGGMLTTTLLSLLVLPIIYGQVLKLAERNRKGQDDMELAV